MPESPRRLLLRLGVKLLAIISLLIPAYLLLNGSDSSYENSEKEPALPTLLKIPPLLAATPQRLHWAGGTLQLLRMKHDASPLLFFDRGGKLGCPLVWQPAGKKSAPEQPWPGGFHDQCETTWYRYDGSVLPGQTVSRDLRGPPFRLLSENLLQIGTSGDNAAPANTPAQ